MKEARAEVGVRVPGVARAHVEHAVIRARVVVVRAAAQHRTAGIAVIAVTEICIEITVVDGFDRNAHEGIV